MSVCRKPRCKRRKSAPVASSRGEAQALLDCTPSTSGLLAPGEYLSCKIWAPAQRHDGVNRWNALHLHPLSARVSDFVTKYSCEKVQNYWKWSFEVHRKVQPTGTAGAGGAGDTPGARSGEGGIQNVKLPVVGMGDALSWSI